MSAACVLGSILAGCAASLARCPGMCCCKQLGPASMWHHACCRASLLTWHLTASCRSVSCVLKLLQQQLQKPLRYWSAYQLCGSYLNTG